MRYICEGFPWEDMFEDDAHVGEDYDYGYEDYDYMDGYERAVGEAEELNRYFEDQRAAERSREEDERSYITVPSGENGGTVRMIEVFGGHAFTEQEVAQMLSGSIVEAVIDEREDRIKTRAFRIIQKEFNGRMYHSYDIAFNTTQFRDSGSELVSYKDGEEWKQFRRVWSNHRFTADEIMRLIAGETISFDAVSKAGNEYTAVGKLENYTYNNREYFGFRRSDN